MNRLAARRVTCALLMFAATFGVPLRAEAYEKEVQSWVKSLSPKLCTPTCRRVAVVDFNDLQGNVTELGRFLAEELSVSLGSVPGLTVVERARLGQILREQRLESSSLVSPETIQQVGRISGVEALILGTITPFSDTIRVSLKVLDTRTAGLIVAAGGEVPKTGGIADLLQKGINDGQESGGTITTAHGGSGAPPVAAVLRPTKPTPIEAKKFIFDLQSCELSGQTINCLLLVMNLGPDRAIAISKETRLVDDQGNEYPPAEVAIANENMNLYNNWHIKKLLINRLPTKVRLTFNGVLPEATGIASLKLACSTDDDRLPVDFRNVSLEHQAVPEISVIAGALAAGGAPAGIAGELGNAQGNAAPTTSQPQGVVQEITNQINSTGRELVRRGMRKLLNKVLPVPLGDLLPSGQQPPPQTPPQ